MSANANVPSEREEVELLLPWYVMGRLDPADAARVEQCLARDPDLARQFQLIREEHEQSMRGNEAIADRPASNVDRLLADVATRRAARPDVAQPRAARAPVGRSIWEQLKGLFEMPPVGAVRWAGAAAALLIVVQAGIIATMVVRQPTSYAPASGGSETSGRGTVALVGFVGGATASAVIDLLAAHDLAILDGPAAGGLFTVRLGPETMSEAERNAKIEALKARRDVVTAVILLR
jgi:anti-sigma factor RsiW